MVEIFGTNSNDQIFRQNLDTVGNPVHVEDDTIQALDGKDLIADGFGNDKINGGAGNDTFVAGAGADTYEGGAGQDIIDYSNNAALQYAASGERFGGIVIDANDGSNSTGIAQGDSLSSIERLIGTSRDDTIFAGEDMRIMAGDGHDVILDGAGQERLIGGEGYDQFILSKDGETDRISDFHFWDDIIDLSAWGVTSFDQLTISTDGKGARVFIEFEDERLRLDGYSESDINRFSAEDFLFTVPDSPGLAMNVIHGENPVIPTEFPIDANGDGLSDVLVGDTENGYGILAGNTHGQNDFHIDATDLEAYYYQDVTERGFYTETLDIEGWAQSQTPALLGDTNADGVNDLYYIGHTNELGEHIVLGYDGDDGISDGVTISQTGGDRFGPNSGTGLRVEDNWRIQMELVNGHEDFNGDSIDDLLITTSLFYTAHGGSGYDYEVFTTAVVYGQTGDGLDTDIVLQELRPDQGIILEQYRAEDYPYPVHTVERFVGDISGDGQSDVIQTAFAQVAYPGDDREEYQIYLGGTDLDGEPDYVISGVSDMEGTRNPNHNLQVVGDFNGDAINDFIIWEENREDRYDQESYLIMGGTANLDALDAADGTIDGRIDVNEVHRVQFVATDSDETTTLMGTSTRDVFDTDTFDENGNSVDDSGQIIIAGGGRDRVFDGAGDDTIDGGTGRDTFFAGGGADSYDGGAGEDILSYHNSETGLTIDAQDGSNSTGIAAGDTVNSVERLFGSDFKDIIHADDDMRVQGLDGDDILYDAHGKERLSGGEGSDRFTLGSDGETDRIDDFQIGEDVLDLSAWGVTSFDQLSISSDGKGARIFVEFGDERLRLDRFTEDDIGLFESADFVFDEPATLIDAIMLPPLPDAEIALLEEEEDDLGAADFE